jgi:hypothetical protein
MPFRKLIADLYCILFCRGERRTLFSTLAYLLEQIGPKGSLTSQGRITSVVVLGQLSLVLGSQISSYLQDTVKVFCSTYVKGTDPVLREVCLVALIQSLSTSSGSSSANLDTYLNASKVFLRAIADKVSDIRVLSADAIILLAESKHFTKASLEPILTAACKALDDEFIGVRASFARAVGCLIAVSVEAHLGDSTKSGDRASFADDAGSDAKKGRAAPPRRGGGGPAGPRRRARPAQKLLV